MNVKLDAGAFLPKRAYPTDAGLDLFARKPFFIKPEGTALVDTGVHLAIPEGYFGKIESKSGLCVKCDITAEAGVIDSSYRGSIVVKLRNDSNQFVNFNSGDKIAQLVILPCSLCECTEVDELDDTDRGSKGFGSTGR